MMRNKILQGDAIELVKTLKDESVNCVITSPPYFGLRDYKLPPTKWPEVAYAPMAGLPEITIPAVTCCLGLEDSIEAYVGHMVLVFRELWRVLRGDGVAWLNLGDSYSSGNRQSQCDPSGNTGQANLTQGVRRPPTSNLLKPKDLCGTPWRVAFALQSDGWYLRSDIIWAKKNPMPESVTDRPTKAHEYLFMLAKSDRYWYDQDAIREPHTDLLPNGKRSGGGIPKGVWINGPHGIKQGEGNTHHILGRNKRTVWHLASQPLKEAHFAVMPEALVEPCLLAGCPAQVCIECGEPWVRVVERERARKGATPNINGRYETMSGNTAKLSLPSSLRVDSTKSGMGTPLIKTLHFTPTCQCCPLPANKEATRPGIALDPFFGSGTVGVVAKKHKRDWAGIELNPEYAELARARLERTQPGLFAMEA